MYQTSTGPDVFEQSPFPMVRLESVAPQRVRQP